MTNTLLGLGDCLELMKKIPDGTVDMILCDLPYGTTACKWDVIIPFDKLWVEYERIIKANGAIVLFGSEPFSSLLRTSNLKLYRYDWIWKKDKATGHLNAKKQPMREIETISIFYKAQSTYNPQLYKKDPKNVRPASRGKQPSIYNESDKDAERAIDITLGYPRQLLEFRSCSADKGKSFHPTQKPVALLEYLIKTYTNEGELVLDNTIGSGSTGVAAANLNRNFIGIEKDPKYFEIAVERITKDKPELNVEFFE